MCSCSNVAINIIVEFLWSNYLKSDIRNMSKKKSKKCQSLTSSKWIEMRDGTFSLVIESKKPTAARTSHFSEVNNNKVIIIYWWSVMDLVRECFIRFTLQCISNSRKFPNFFAFKYVFFSSVSCNLCSVAIQMCFFSSKYTLKLIIFLLLSKWCFEFIFFSIRKYCNILQIVYIIQWCETKLIWIKSCLFV